MSTTTTSPRSPFDMNIHPTRNRLFKTTMMNNHGVCGVGLGIVAEMEKSGEIPATSRALFVQNIWRSNPIPINKAKTGKLDFHSNSSSESEEEYMTYVTRRRRGEGPNREMMTRVVYSDEKNRMGKIKKVERQRLEKSVKNSSIFDISPARYSPPAASSPSFDFLNSCHLCKKKLHGKDIYIYRGEKGFCSPECRYREIVMEKKEKSSSRSLSSFGYSINGGQIILSPEILAT